MGNKKKSCRGLLVLRQLEYCYCAGVSLGLVAGLQASDTFSVERSPGALVDQAFHSGSICR